MKGRGTGTFENYQAEESSNPNDSKELRIDSLILKAAFPVGAAKAMLELAFLCKTAIMIATIVRVLPRTRTSSQQKQVFVQQRSSPQAFAAHPSD